MLLWEDFSGYAMAATEAQGEVTSPPGLRPLRLCPCALPHCLPPLLMLCPQCGFVSPWLLPFLSASFLASVSSNQTFSLFPPWPMGCPYPTPPWLAAPRLPPFLQQQEDSLEKVIKDTESLFKTREKEYQETIDQIEVRVSAVEGSSRGSQARLQVLCWPPHCGTPRPLTGVSSPPPSCGSSSGSWRPQDLVGSNLVHHHPEQIFCLPSFLFTCMCVCMYWARAACNCMVCVWRSELSLWGEFSPSTCGSQGSNAGWGLCSPC